MNHYETELNTHMKLRIVLLELCTYDLSNLTYDLSNLDQIKETLGPSKVEECIIKKLKV